MENKCVIHLAARKLNALAHGDHFYYMGITPVPVISIMVEYAAGFICSSGECGESNHTMFAELPNTLCRCCCQPLRRAVLDTSGQWVDLYLRKALLNGNDMGDTYWMPDANGFSHLEVEMPAFLVHLFQGVNIGGSSVLESLSLLDFVKLTSVADFDTAISAEKQWRLAQVKRQAFTQLHYKYQEWLFLDETWSPFFAAYVIEVNMQSKEYQEAQWCRDEDDDCVAKLLVLLEQLGRHEPPPVHPTLARESSLYWKTAPAILARPIIPETPQGRLQQIPVLRAVSRFYTPTRKQLEVDVSAAPKPKEPVVVVQTVAERRAAEKQAQRDRKQQEARDKEEKQRAKRDAIATRKRELQKQFGGRKKNKEFLQAERRKALGKERQQLKNSRRDVS